MDIPLWFLFLWFVITVLYLLFDVNYYIRLISTMIWAKYFNKKINLDEIGVIYGLCTTNDLDFFLNHMNNARQLRELDFARFQFYDRTGLLKEILDAKAHVLQVASFIRHRRPIPLFSTYKVTTKLIYYADKVLYLEQQIISLNDGFVRSVILSKQTVLGLDVLETLKKLSGQEHLEKLVMPADLQHLLNCIDESSAKLRKKDE